MPRVYETGSSHMLRIIRNFRCNTCINFEPMNILSKFYPNKALAPKDISGKSDYIYHNVTRLVKQNYLEKIDSNHFAARYKITLYGKCRIICCKFGIKFLCLCILAEAYSIHKHQRANGCKQMYTLHDITDIFTGIFSEKTIRNAGYLLCSQRFANRTSCNMIQIKKDTLKKLGKYDDVLVELHEWIISVPKSA